MIAVGGYGRRELFPHSDIDLLLLFGAEPDLAAAKQSVSTCIRTLWDAGLRVSHSVRTVAECCRLQEGNSELHISLLDRRFLCGDANLFETLRSKLALLYSRQGGSLSVQLARLAQQRHRKYHDTVYHLEPDVKQAPGGMRDVHLTHWLWQLSPQTAALREMISELEESREFLYALRCFLHLRSSRDNNLLSFELQDAAAEGLMSEPLAAEDWMRLYFQHARAVFHAARRAMEVSESHTTGLAAQFVEWRNRLSTSEFTVIRERLLLRNPAETLSSVESLFRAFTFVARHGVSLSWDAHARIRARVRDSGVIASGGASWRTWHELLSQPYAAIALRDMQQTGFLKALIPEWHQIENLVIRDFYHRYTVDEHTFVAIETIDALSRNARPAPAAMRELLLEDEDPAVLRMALLLHDIGKGAGDGHIERSLAAATRISERLQIPVAEREMIDFLIRNHLELSAVMSHRDLDDPATSRLIAERTGDADRLRRLTLMTYADIAAVNPSAMNAWRLEQLLIAYSIGRQQLTRELAGNRIPPKSRVPPVAPDGAVAVNVELAAAGHLMTIAAHDRPGLFADICGVLASFGMNILRGEAFPGDSGWVFDIIRFADPLRTLELNPVEIDRLRSTMKAAVQGSIPVRPLLARRPRPHPPSPKARIEPWVQFDNEATPGATLIDFVGFDYPGLLFELASVLTVAGCNIDVVLIDTQGHKARDVFYVTRKGEQVDEALQQQLQAELLRTARLE